MPTKSRPIKTAAQVRAEFAKAGISLAEWSRVHGVSYDVARSVMSGRLKSTRGESHRIAVALGLKEGRVIAPRLFAPMPRATRPRLNLVKANSN